MILLERSYRTLSSAGAEGEPMEEARRNLKRITRESIQNKDADYIYDLLDQGGHFKRDNLGFDQQGEIVMKLASWIGGEVSDSTILLAYEDIIAAQEREMLKRAKQYAKRM